MSVPVEDVYFKTVDENKEQVILKMTLPVIDARDAVRRFPHEYATKVDGFAAAPPATAGEAPAAIGAHGGKPSLIGGIGVKEVIRPAPAPKPAAKNSAAAA